MDLVIQPPILFWEHSHSTSVLEAPNLQDRASPNRKRPQDVSKILLPSFVCKTSSTGGSYLLEDSPQPKQGNRSSLKPNDPSFSDHLTQCQKKQALSASR